MQEQIFDLLLEQEEVSWKTILYDLVRTEQMNPWDVDITLLTQKYIQMIQKMQEHDLKVSGKVLLAAAVLLKIKSSHLIDNDISKLDALINSTEDEDIEDDFFDSVEGETRNKQKFALIPRNPQPRSRKVSVHDLVNALQRAMASKKRVLAKIRPEKFIIPHAKIDIMEVIHDIYQKLQYYSKKEKGSKVTFTKLLPPRAGKEDKVYTFIPLLHLENHRKVDMHQEKAFSEIHVNLAKKSIKA